MALARRKQPGITGSCSGKCELEDVLKMHNRVYMLS
jgi:hypothetical protein